MTSTMAIRTTLAVFFLYAIGISSGEVRYVCFSKGETVLKLRCPEGQKIKVEEARYGWDRWGACLLLNPRPGGGDFNCTHVTNVSLDCCGQQNCNVTVSKVYLPTCGFTSSFLRVIYGCVIEDNVTCDGKSKKVPPRPPAVPPGPLPSVKPILTSPTPPGRDEAPPWGSGSSLETTSSTEGPTPGLPPWGPDTMVTSVWDRTRGPGLKARESVHPADNGISDGAIRAVWACLGVGVIIIVFLSVLLVLSCRRNGFRWRKDRGKQTPQPSNGNIEVAESEFGCRKTPEGGRDSTNNNDTKSSSEKGHINSAFQINDERGSNRKRLSPTKSSKSKTEGKNCSLSDSGVDVSGTTSSTVSQSPATVEAPSSGGSDTLSRKRKHPDTEVATTPCPEIK